MFGRARLGCGEGCEAWGRSSRTQPTAFLPPPPPLVPPPLSCRSIYLQLLQGHLAAGGFPESVRALGARLVDATIELHRAVMIAFLPSAGG